MSDDADARPASPAAELDPGKVSKDVHKARKFWESDSYSEYATEPDALSLVDDTEDLSYGAGSSAAFTTNLTRRLTEKVVQYISRVQGPRSHLTGRKYYLGPAELHTVNSVNARRQKLDLGVYTKRSLGAGLHAPRAAPSAAPEFVVPGDDASDSDIQPSTQFYEDLQEDKSQGATAAISLPGTLMDQLDHLGSQKTVSEPTVASDADAESATENSLEREMSQELDNTWILNLSMRYNDHRDREKFFITYRKSEHDWRRVTVTLDYGDAPEDSLEEDLRNTDLQRSKSRKIYEAIRDSLDGIEFFTTVTVLKILTVAGRLHIHVVEDENEIIQYPTTSSMKYLNCRSIKESDIVFGQHMSGFVYKVSVGAIPLIRKDIPGPEDVEAFKHEADALHRLAQSDHVIDFYGLVVDETEEHVKGLLIDYADGGALIDIIYDSKVKGLPWSLKERWAKQIVHGLSDTHEMGIVSGDLTLSNIVIDKHDNVKLIDFNKRGIPVGWEPPELAPLVGTRPIARYIGVKSDIFQLGMVLWALAMEEDEPELKKRPLTFGPECDIPEWYRRITEICLDSDPRKRYQASDLLQLFPEEPEVQPGIDNDDNMPISSDPDLSSKADPQDAEESSCDEGQPIRHEANGQSSLRQMLSIFPKTTMTKFQLFVTQTKLSDEKLLEALEAQRRSRYRLLVLSVLDVQWVGNTLIGYMSRLAPRITTSLPRSGYRRIKWTCDCGKALHADFHDQNGEGLDDLAFSLRNPGQQRPNKASRTSSGSSQPLGVQPRSASGTSPQGPAQNTTQNSASSQGPRLRPDQNTATSQTGGGDIPMFLAVCVNSGSIYKTLVEIDVSKMKSDAAAFLAMKKAYLKTRGPLSRFSFLIRPVTVEFVQFTLWNLRSGYVSVCDRPDSIPPDDSIKYEYLPKPLQPLPPMPPEIFIHYLQHGEGDLNPIRNDWLPRLPKRRSERVIDTSEACHGWGLHVIEGPNREAIFWIAMTTIAASVLTSILWSTVQNDVQGGAGLGALIVALPPAILTAFLFRLGAL